MCKATARAEKLLDRIRTMLEPLGWDVAMSLGPHDMFEFKFLFRSARRKQVFVSSRTISSLELLAKEYDKCEESSRGTASEQPTGSTDGK